MNSKVHLTMTSRSLTLIALALLGIALVKNTQAALPPPPPDGGYPGGNTAEGDNALLHVNTAIGINNTAVGANALRDNSTGYYNVAVGSGALANNTTGNFNMAIGAETLTNNNSNFNLAIGFRVGYLNTTGNHLTGIGAAALRNNTIGSQNTAIGADAMRENTAGANNTSIGADALVSNNTGVANTAVGFDALASNTSASTNTAVGTAALANSTGIGNTALGANAGLNVTFANNVIAIATGGSNVTGSYFIGNIRGVTTAVADALPVVIDSSHQLGTMSSSRRFKKEIHSMANASEAILALNPVTFHYKSDKTRTPQFGLVAEEVAEVNPDLVVRDQNGEIYTVRYDAVNAMLLNEFLKEHRKVQKLEAALARQEEKIEALATSLQKVSAQLKTGKPAPQIVVSNQ